MSLPDTASLEAFSLVGLREVVGRLVGEVRRLHSDNAVLQARVDAQQATIAALRAENQALRDEVARLKGLPPRPPSRPSGMEQATQPGAADADEKRPKPPRGAKRDAQAITAERVLKASVPAGSRFKDYEDILVRDLRLSAEVIRYRRERWVTPSGATVLAALPAGIVGGFGPELRRFVLALHAQGQVTTERLTALLNGIRVEISKRQVVRLLAEPLDGFVDLFPSVHGGFDPCAPVVSRRVLPRHAPALGDALQVAVPLRGCGLGHVAGHGACARRDDHGRLRMALGDAGVNAIPVVGAVAGERRHGPCDLVEQGADLRRVVHVLGGQRRRTIRPVPASTPRCSMRHDRRVAVPCFSSSHSPLPHSFRPVLSTSRCMGSLPAPASAFPGRGTSSVAARRLSVVWSGTRKLRPSRPMTEPSRPSACR